jgi:hypothetical protein
MDFFMARESKAGFKMNWDFFGGEKLKGEK